LAEAARTSEHKSLFIEMAERWLTLAEHAAREGRIRSAALRSAAMSRTTRSTRCCPRRRSNPSRSRDILAKFSEMGVNVVETEEAEPEDEVAREAPEEASCETELRRADRPARAW